MAKPKYADLFNMPEDKRIEMIGHAAMCLRKTVGFVVDSDPGKADRYISKLQAKFPGIVIIARFDGPVKNTVIIKVGPPAENRN